MNKNIDILMIAPGEGKQGGGGIAAYAKILTNRLDANFQVKRIVTLRHNTMTNKIITLVFAIIKLLFFLTGKNKKIAHIHTAESNSFLRKSIFVRLCRFFNVPIVLHLHSGFIEEVFDKKSEREKERMRNIFKLAEKVIVLSENWKRWYIKSIEKRTPLVIYNGMEDLMTINDKISKRKNHILFLGRLGKNKGTYDLINAFEKVIKKHSDAQLILCGDGEVNECKKLVNSLQIHDSVKFLNWIGLEKKIDLLNSSKIFALPSYNECFPLSILEAMSARLPIISSHAGGIPEEIEDKKSGFLIEAGDVQALSSTINRILDNDSLCDEIGSNARQRYLKYFRMSKIIKDIEKIYYELTHKNKNDKKND